MLPSLRGLPGRAALASAGSAGMLQPLLRKGDAGTHVSPVGLLALILLVPEMGFCSLAGPARQQQRHPGLQRTSFVFAKVSEAFALPVRVRKEQRGAEEEEVMPRCDPFCPLLAELLCLGQPGQGSQGPGCSASTERKAGKTGASSAPSASTDTGTSRVPLVLCPGTSSPGSGFSPSHRKILGSREPVTAARAPKLLKLRELDLPPRALSHPVFLWPGGAVRP